MQHNRTIVALALLATGTLTLTALTPSLAGPKTGTVKMATARGKMTKGSAAAAHIKRAKGINTRGKEVHKSRAEAATVVMKNQTGWYINCYIDGNFVGQVGPNAELFPHTTTGSHELYAVATFDDGTQKTWGPSTYVLDYIFSWSLTD